MFFNLKSFFFVERKEKDMKKKRLTLESIRILLRIHQNGRINRLEVVPSVGSPVDTGSIVSSVISRLVVTPMS